MSYSLAIVFTSEGFSDEVVNFLNDHYSNAAYSSVVNGNGFDLPTAYVSAIEADFLSNSSGLNLNINGSECTAGSGR